MTESYFRDLNIRDAIDIEDSGATITMGGSDISITEFSTYKYLSSCDTIVPTQQAVYDYSQQPLVKQLELAETISTAGTIVDLGQTLSISTSDVCVKYGVIQETGSSGVHRHAVFDGTSNVHSDLITGGLYYLDVSNGSLVASDSDRSHNFVGTAISATIENGKHAQGTLSYTVSPVHTMDLWVDMAKELQDLGSHSICIKDMAGLLKPYVAFELVSRLKEVLEVPVALAQ